MDTKEACNSVYATGYNTGFGNGKACVAGYHASYKTSLVDGHATILVSNNANNQP